MKPAREHNGPDGCAGAETCQGGRRKAEGGRRKAQGKKIELRLTNHGVLDSPPYRGGVAAEQRGW